MRLVRREADDVLTRDGQTAVLMDGEVRRLSALSAEVYALLEAPLDIEELARELGSRFGSPEGTSVAEATKNAVADLIRHGIIRRV